ncbi:MAG: fluoride efflux transporter CrcB [Acuticoccus sp.]
MNPLAASALVACGGALGALGRFWVAVVLNKVAGTHLPFATLASNLTGSFLIGVMAMLIAHRAELAAFVMVGILGGFTTFSTFSLETVRLFQAGRAIDGLVYAAASAVGCVLAAALGMILGRWVS